MNTHKRELGSTSQRSIIEVTNHHKAWQKDFQGSPQRPAHKPWRLVWVLLPIGKHSEKGQWHRRTMDLPECMWTKGHGPQRKIENCPNAFKSTAKRGGHLFQLKQVLSLCIKPHSSLLKIILTQILLFFGLLILACFCLNRIESMWKELQAKMVELS